MGGGEGGRPIHGRKMTHRSIVFGQDCCWIEPCYYEVRASMCLILSFELLEKDSDINILLNLCRKE